jgi:hypothetical protein
MNLQDSVYIYKGLSMSKQDEIATMARMLFDKYGVVALDTKQAAEAMGQAEVTLKQNRANAMGLQFVKLGASVRYSVMEIAKYLIERTQRTI